MLDYLPQNLVPSLEVIESGTEDEVVLLHLGSDVYFGLDAVGARIWSMLEAGTSLPEIRDRLAMDYEVDPAVITADMVRFLNHLRTHDLVHD